MEFIPKIRSLLQRLGILRDKRDGPFKAGHIVLNDGGFTIIRTGRQRASVNWSDVRTITTMKRDRHVHDSICLGFEIGEGRWVEICEEMVGFMDAGHVMRDHFPSINEDWYFEVMAEPFVLNFAVLWRQGEPMPSEIISANPTP